MLAAALRLVIALVPIHLQQHAFALNGGGPTTLAVTEDRRRTGQRAIRDTVQHIGDHTGGPPGL